MIDCHFGSDYDMWLYHDVDWTNPDFYYGLPDQIEAVDIDDTILVNAEDAIEQVRKLKAENFKLRELASVAICHMTPEGHQSSCNRECPAYKMCAGKSECKIIDWIDERASELWIEVE